jgi:hypothetical protein
MANRSKTANISYVDADIYPHEKWAIISTYPTLQKITRQLDATIIKQYNQEGILTYLQKKHNLSPELLEQIDQKSLYLHLRSQ